MGEREDGLASAHDEGYALCPELPAHEDVALARSAAGRKRRGRGHVVSWSRGRLELVEDQVGGRGLQVSVVVPVSTNEDDETPPVRRPEHIDVLAPSLDTLRRPRDGRLHDRRLSPSADAQAGRGGLTRTSHTPRPSLVSITKKLPFLLGLILRSSSSWRGEGMVRTRAAEVGQYIAAQASLAYGRTSGTLRRKMSARVEAG